MPEGRNAGSLQSLVESLGTASLFQHLDRGHIQGISQRKAQSHRAIETVIVIVWTIKSGLGCEVVRDVGYDCPRKCAIFERAQIGKRLQRGSGGPSAPGSMDLANSVLEIVARSDESHDIAGRIIDDNNCRGRDVFVRQRMELASDHPVNPSIER